VNYISTLGWPEDKENFNKFWTNADNVVQYCGKDNLRQQSAMWQAMLMAAGLKNTRQIVIDGFLTGDGGIKMSKSLGNVVNPFDVVKEYGTDALRYYLLREASPFEDSPFTLEKFKEAYNSGLANGLGNLVSRVMKMAETNNVQLNVDDSVKIDIAKLSEYYENYEINKVCDEIWSKIQDLDKYIQENQPFKTVKTDLEKGKSQISYLLSSVHTIANVLKPILPGTSDKILKSIEQGKVSEPLFLRK
jgi:methionyl-tRNA synthetase